MIRNLQRLLPPAKLEKWWEMSVDPWCQERRAFADLVIKKHQSSLHGEKQTLQLALHAILPTMCVNLDVLSLLNSMHDLGPRTMYPHFRNYLLSICLDRNHGKPRLASDPPYPRASLFLPPSCTKCAINCGDMAGSSPRRTSCFRTKGCSNIAISESSLQWHNSMYICINMWDVCT